MEPAILKSCYEISSLCLTSVMALWTWPSSGICLYSRSSNSSSTFCSPSLSFSFSASSKLAAIFYSSSMIYGYCGLIILSEFSELPLFASTSVMSNLRLLPILYSPSSTAPPVSPLLSSPLISSSSLIPSTLSIWLLLPWWPTLEILFFEFRCWEWRMMGIKFWSEFKSPREAPMRFDAT